MFRLLGILLGSAIAVGILIMLVGVPQLGKLHDQEPVSVHLPLTAEPLAMPEVTPPPEPVADVEIPGESQAQSSVEVAELPPSSPASLPPLEPESMPIQETVAGELRWYAFWSPFRSQIAANGFVAQLQRVTGLDYRVVSVKPGVYEVAFAYSDDDEIQANLSQISAATGLDVPEG